MNKEESLLSGLSIIPDLLTKAKSGDQEAAMELLFLAAFSIEHRGEVDPDARAWIADGLKNLARGGNVKSAFGLVKSRGRKASHSALVQRLIAESICWSKSGRYKSVSQNGKALGAYSIAASEFNISENTAESYYKKYRDLIKEEGYIMRQFKADDGE